MQGQRARRIEMLLAHEFHGRKFMLPDRLTAKERDRQAKANGEEVAETTASGARTPFPDPWALVASKDD